MKLHYRVFKAVAALVTVIFVTTATVWSAPQFSLRQLSALERGVQLPGGRVASTDELYGNTQADIDRHRTLIEQERQKRGAETAEDQEFEGEFVRFPEPQPASAQEELINKGRTRQALSKLGIVIAAGGEGSRLLSALKDRIQALVEAGIITAVEAEQLTKVTVPVTPIKGFSTLYIELSIISYICRKYDVDIPVCVVMSPLASNRPSIEGFLSRNNNFGIKKLRTTIQGVNPTYRSDNTEIATRADGNLVFNPNGTGGIVTALAKSGADGRSTIEWFRDKENLGEDGRFLFLNGDNVLTADFIFLVAGAVHAHPEKEYLNFTYRCPLEAKYGVPCELKRGDETSFEVIEFAETVKFKGLREAYLAKRAAGELQANGNMMAFALAGIEEKLSRLPEHVQMDKTSEGVEGKTIKIELFLPDMAGEYATDEVLLVTAEPLPGIKDPDALDAVQKGLIQAWRDMAGNLGIEVEAGGIVEFAPDFDPETVRVGKGVVVRSGARLYIGGGIDYRLEVGNGVKFADGTTIMERNGDVIIEDGVVLSDTHTLQSEIDGQPLYVGLEPSQAVHMRPQPADALLAAI